MHRAKVDVSNASINEKGQKLHLIIFQDQPGTGTSALVSESYQNNTSLIDNRNIFAPIISLVNIDEIWGSCECAYAIIFRMS